MNSHIGRDHAGLEFKNRIVDHLKGHGHIFVDNGPHSFDPLDDYPVFCIPAAEAVVKDPGSLGIVLGGSGNGEQIAANKVKGIRAALVWSHDTEFLLANITMQMSLQLVGGCIPKNLHLN